MKLAERRRAIELLRRHHGWSDRRIAWELGVAPSTIARWRYAEGLGVHTRRVELEERAQLIEPGAARPTFRV